MGKRIDIETVKQQIPKSIFEAFYRTHSISQTADYFNISSNTVERLSKEYGVIKTAEEIVQTKQNTCLEKYGVVNPAMNSNVKKKAVATKVLRGTNLTGAQKGRQTLLDKFGSEEALSKHIVDKQKETLIAKHGTLQKAYEEQLKTRIDTFKDKFGVSNPFQSEAIKQKIRETSSSRYGKEYANQCQEVIDKIYKSKLEHFGPHNFGNWKKGHETRIKKYGSLEASYQSGFEKQKQTMLERYGVECLFLSSDISSHVKKKNSGPNVHFANILRRYRINFDQEFVIENRSYDFKVGNILIEINPSITHNVTFNPFGNSLMDTQYHKEKSELAKKHGFRCIHVWEWEDPEIIVNQFLIDKPIIYARKCTCSVISNDEAKLFVNKYHLQKSAKCTLCIGLRYEDELISVMTFDKPRYNKHYQYELIRYCSSAVVIGGAEKLFNFFVQSYNPQSILSYCDNSKFLGTVYVKLGFTKQDNGVPTRHWHHMKLKKHITDNFLRQRGFDQLFGDVFGYYGKGTRNDELMRKHGFVEIYDCGQSVFTWNALS